MSAPVTRRGEITTDEFERVSAFLYDRTGIVLAAGKEHLVMGRLDRRLRQLDLDSYSDYLALLADPGHAVEARHAVDLLTTNETYFFREPEHFAFLSDVVVPAAPLDRPLRLWSAASSSGEEAYSAAMVLAAAMPRGRWEILSSDVSSRVLETGRLGVYPLEAAAKIPMPLLREYCRRGRDRYQGQFAIARELRSRVEFVQANLLEDLSALGEFDVILLRNVMIYFDQQTRARLVQKMVQRLRPHGYLIVSRSETLNGISRGLRLLEPSIYQLNPVDHG